MNLFEQTAGLRFATPLPSTLLEVCQQIDAPCVADLPAAIREQMVRLLTGVQPGQSVAVGVPSRGVAGLPEVVRGVVAAIRAHGAQPYLVPAMGSHGGATAAGQIAVLERLGVTEASAGAPLHATMEVLPIGTLDDGTPLYQGRDSYTADHTVLVSRVKPHTDFRGHLESGPAKMAVIGLGKQQGAVAMHTGGTAAFQRLLAPAARLYASRTNLLGALCLVENAREETAIVQALTRDEIGTESESALLEAARRLMARLPLDTLDVLLVRRIGKNISGTGLDPNVVGRLRIPGQDDRFGPLSVAVIAVLDLTNETHGHASGIGLADVTTRRLVEKIDWAATYTNGITAGIFGLQRQMLPIPMADDRSALEVAVRCCGRPAAQARLALIEDTLHLERFWVSETVRSTVETRPGLVVTGECPLSFDAQGTMLSPWQMG
jgi:hypothetical protein